MTIQRKSKRPQVARDWTRKVFNRLRQVKGDHELPPSGALFALQLPNISIATTAAPRGPHVNISPLASACRRARW